MALISDNPVWFGKYRLTSRIATGGMAEVFVGRLVSSTGQMGPMVAVKRLLPHLLSQSFIVQMFLNEARITAQIHHDNVVEVLDLGHENGEPFIVMELLEGRSFSDIRQRAAELGRRVPLRVTLRVLVDACNGLDAAHRAVDEKGRQLCIVHRDFTPDNIHVGVDGRIKLLDFGIAKAEHLSSGTEPGTLKGKFFYMSPEMIAGRPVDHRADLFAAGVMLYEQLCGRRPFTGTSPDEVLQRIAEGRQRRPTEFDPSGPAALEAVCMKALASKPEDRYGSVGQLVREIEAVGGGAQLATSEEVAAYVNELFPVEQDPKRQTLRRARQADPSMAGSPRAEENSSATAPAPPTKRRPSARPKWAVGVAAGGVGLAVLVMGVWVFPRLFRRPTVAQRLEAAIEIKEAAPRERALRALAEDPLAAPAQFRRVGQLLLEMSAFEGALSVAERYEARFPQEEAARLLEARACIGLRQGKRAEVAIERAATLGPNDNQPDLIMADLKEAQGDYSAALESLARAAKKQPSRGLAGRRGYLLSQVGRLDEAAEVLSQLVAKRFDPDSAAELGFVRYRQNQLPEAIQWLHRAVKESPRLAKAHYYLGAVLYRQGDLKAAEKAYRDADDLAPQDPRALVALCQIQQGAGQVKAVEALKKALDERFASQAAELKKQCAP